MQPEVNKEMMRCMKDDPLERCLLQPDEDKDDDEAQQFQQLLEASPPLKSAKEECLELDSALKQDGEDKPETPKVELKPLPPTLRYEFMGPNSTYPVIINANELNAAWPGPT